MKLRLLRPDVLAGFLTGLAAVLLWPRGDEPSSAARAQTTLLREVRGHPAGKLPDLRPDRLDYTCMFGRTGIPYSNKFLKSTAVYAEARRCARNPAEAARLLTLANQATSDWDLSNAILEGLADGNPEWLLEHLHEMRPSGARMGAAMKALGRIFRRDPDAARKRYPSFSQSERVVEQSVECRMAAEKGDLDALIAYYEKPKIRDGDLHTWMTWALLNHPELLPEIRRRAPQYCPRGGDGEYGPATEDVLAAAAGGIPPADFLKWIAALYPKDFPVAMQVVGEAMTPAEVIAQCRQSAGGDRSREAELAAAVASDLAQRAPQEGLRWLAELEVNAEGRARSELGAAANDFAREWTRAHRSDALAAALAAGRESLMSEMIVRAAFSGGVAYDAGVAEAGGIQDASLRDLALSSLVRNGYTIEPERTLPVLDRIQDPKALEGAVTEVFRRWSGSDPAAPANWLAGHAPAWGTDAMKEVFQVWADRDPDAAAARALELSAGPLRDVAAGQVAGGLATRDPAGSLAWAGGIVDDGIRRAALRDVVATQLRAGVNTEAALPAAALTPAVQAEVNNLLSK